ncbi:MAG: hypothetical protein KIT33_02260 [Candidatus Kapabacteria bacterium]|nr:hypothetical protein [Ignavibacteriota bacterium]MCW5883773.1 hypothetical protein [Candidatus Kapabacteria bacterium]
MKFCNIKFALLGLLMIFTSCDETSKPSSSYLIDKKIQASSEEQIIESGSDFKMIFPANSISNNLEVKVKKESSLPGLNIPNQKPGKNFYRIKFSGDTEFQKPVKLIINYDKSAIPDGKTAQESVFGYIYSSGSWKLADYQLDEANGKIIISISSILGKTYKDEPILLDDGEIIIGDAYTTTDTGQGDDLLAKLKYFVCKVELGDFIVVKQSTNQEHHFEYSSISSSSAFETGPGYIDTVFVKWNGTKFSIQRDFQEVNRQIRLTVSGEINKQTWISNNLVYQYTSIMQVGENDTRTTDIMIKLKPIQSFYKDFWGSIQTLDIDTYKVFEQGKYDHDLIKHAEEVNFTLTFKQGDNTVDIYTLKQLNDNPKLNKFSLSLRSNP